MHRALPPALLALLVSFACSGTPEIMDGGAEDAGDVSGLDAGSDAGSPPRDAGAPPRDGSVPDASGPADSGLPPFVSLLQLLTELNATERDPVAAGYRSYDLTLEQPNSHAAGPGAGTFEHRAILHVRDSEPVTAPLVVLLFESGLYDDYYLFDTTQWVAGNQLEIEHRDYGDSLVSTEQRFSELTLENAAADVHAWLSEFRRLFTGRVITAGLAGPAALAHRAFHPGDAFASVMYGVGDMDGAPDSRYVEALSSLGPSVCHARLHALQLELLGPRRIGVRDVIANRTPPPSFSHLGGADRAYEAMVKNLAIDFWQSYGQPRTCDSIPDSASANDVELAEFLDDTYSSSFANDENLESAWPYYYRAARQIGYPAIPVDHLAAVLTTDVPTLERGTLPPEVARPSYDPTADRLIDEWVQTEARRLLFVGGTRDPYMAVSHPVDAARDVVEFRAADTGTGVGLELLSDEDKAAARALLVRWAVP